MQPSLGEFFEGKVTGITKFGAFVSLPGGENGLVHISEIANSYVNDVSDFVSVGQVVRVKVLGVNEAGKINLSIKQASEPAEKKAAAQKSAPPPRQSGQRPGSQQSAPPVESAFEDKLKQFMQDSDNRISGCRMYGDKKTGYRRKRD